MSTTVETVKCACTDCVCVIDYAKGISREGRIYCDESCASHHADGAGCHHHGCTCSG